MTAGFDGYSIKCGEYFFQHLESSYECTSNLEQQTAECLTRWFDGNCDDALDYWSRQCAVTALIVNDYFGGKLVWANALLLTEGTFRITSTI
ncbi:MAG: hypothetical protein QME12_06660 [Nanoarchaeota archaeon]|nr:hypothetical protein [Nanoarchaeota archaeon]